VCGRAEVALGDVVIRSLLERFGEGRAMNDTCRSLETMSEELALELEAV
jgi:hypothetical protein